MYLRMYLRTEKCTARQSYEQCAYSLGYDQIVAVLSTHFFQKSYFLLKFFKKLYEIRNKPHKDM